MKTQTFFNRHEFFVRIFLIIISFLVMISFGIIFTVCLSTSNSFMIRSNLSVANAFQVPQKLYGMLDVLSNIPKAFPNAATAAPPIAPKSQLSADVDVSAFAIGPLQNEIQPQFFTGSQAQASAFTQGQQLLSSSPIFSPPLNLASPSSNANSANQPIAIVISNQPLQTQSSASGGFIPGPGVTVNGQTKPQQPSSNVFFVPSTSTDLDISKFAIGGQRQSDTAFDAFPNRQSVSSHTAFPGSNPTIWTREPESEGGPLLQRVPLQQSPFSDPTSSLAGQAAAAFTGSQQFSQSPVNQFPVGPQFLAGLNGQSTGQFGLLGAGPFGSSGNLPLPNGPNVPFGSAPSFPNPAFGSPFQNQASFPGVSIPPLAIGSIVQFGSPNPFGGLGPFGPSPFGSFANGLPNSFNGFGSGPVAASNGLPPTPWPPQPPAAFNNNLPFGSLAQPGFPGASRVGTFSNPQENGPGTQAFISDVPDDENDNGIEDSPSPKDGLSGWSPNMASGSPYRDPSGKVSIAYNGNGASYLPEVKQNQLLKKKPTYYKPPPPESKYVSKDDRHGLDYVEDYRNGRYENEISSKAIGLQVPHGNSHFLNPTAAQIGPAAFVVDYPSNAGPPPLLLGSVDLPMSGLYPIVGNPGFGGHSVPYGYGLNPYSTLTYYGGGSPYPRYGYGGFYGNRLIPQNFVPFSDRDALWALAINELLERKRNRFGKMQDDDLVTEILRTQREKKAANENLWRQFLTGAMSYLYSRLT